MEITKYKGARFDYYQVNDGETLIAIMQKFNLPANSVVRNNPSIDFYEGEVVKLIYETKQMHVVKPMENLTNIAQQYNLTVEDLIELNNLKSTRLFIGQNLIIKQ
ncbi:MAG: LysM peptidoglycan-binding domain-containing protein [Clostridia bacterium]|nr:LysM peptidoglycan-binding domain-containing protein [Clostridia bacterium]